MVLGARNVLTNPRNLVSFSVMFGICQNLGGLIGAALLGTFQIVREKFHSSNIVEHLTLLDPRVAARVQSGGSAVGSLIADPSLRNLQGIRSLATAATREANVLAYNDVFMLIAGIAVLTMIWISIRALWLMSTTKTVASMPTPPSGQPSGATSS
jgi:hypothetical protein